MRMLFAHTNYPAQFGQFGEWLAGEGWDVVFLTQREGAASRLIRVRGCKDHREPSDATHQYVRGFEKAVITGQAFARAAIALGAEGWRPDAMMAHSGWGAGPFLKDVFPGAVFVPYFEWHYAYPNADRTPDDAALPRDPVDSRARNRVRNAPFWLDFSSADAALCPTKFQASQFPGWLRRFLTVVHDGVDTDLHRPTGGDRAILARWGTPEDCEVLTSITRGMEPHRGFPETMRAIALLQKRRPKLHAFIGGEDRVCYGAKLPEGDSWKSRMLAELDLDLSRIHFTGLLSRRDMIALMGASDVHLYLTVPFVLSWSLLDAMSVGCLIVASDTAPVREFMSDGETGLLAPPHDPEALAARVDTALDGRGALRPLREAARRRIVETLDARRVIWPAKKAWLEKLAAAKRARREAAPSPAASGAAAGEPEAGPRDAPAAPRAGTSAASPAVRRPDEAGSEVAASLGAPDTAAATDAAEPGDAGYASPDPGLAGIEEIGSRLAGSLDEDGRSAAATNGSGEPWRRALRHADGTEGDAPGARRKPGPGGKGRAAKPRT